MNPNLRDFLEQGLNLKNNLDELKKNLGNKTFKVIGGDQEVELVFNGVQEVISVTLTGVASPQKERLEMLLKRTINQGIARSRQLAGEEMASYTGLGAGFFENFL